ncbi:MAG: hypothetical protein NUW21_12200, partial [Elusimicrobia bacterium]|nr:hypothetical protein [Elusimicrobiota bacterium]
MLFAGSVAAAQAPAGRAAAKAALDAACGAGDCSNAQGVFDAASRADDEFQACGPSCAKPALARMKIALIYSMSTWTAAAVGGVDPQPVIAYAVELDDALDARGPFDAADLARAESEWLCAEKRPACARVRRANEGLSLLADGLARCGAGECPPDALASICRGAQEANDDLASREMPGTYARARLKELAAPLEALLEKKLGPGLDAGEAELGDVDRALESAAAGRADRESPDALSGRLESAQAQWRQAAQAVNFCQAGTPSVERLNAVARGLSSARARLTALRVARGLADPGREAGEGVFARGSGGAPAAPAAAVAPQRRGRSDVLALSSALQPPGKVAEPASLLIRGEGVPAPSAEEAEELGRIQRLREKGGTRLVGDPARRAALIHEQTGQDCVI